MKQLIVGTYEIGSDYVQIVLQEGNDGEGYIKPEWGKVMRVKIGCDGDWHSAVAKLNHELWELLLLKLRLKYCPYSDYANDVCTGLFVFNHEQFADISARVGMCFADCLPDVSKAWKKWKRK